jgi:hypothetical protein
MAGGDLRATRLGQAVCFWVAPDSVVVGVAVLAAEIAAGLVLATRGYRRARVLWFYRLDTDRDIQGRYPRGWCEFDYLVSTATLRSFPDSLLQAREAQPRSRVVASFGRGTQRVEIRKVHAPPLSPLAERA